MFTRVRWDMRLTDKEVLKAVNKADRPINYRQLATLLDCSEMTIRRSISRLKEKNILQQTRRGSLPSEYQVNLDQVPEDIRRELA